MFWKWFWKVTAILLVLALFVGGGIAIYKAGYAQGAAADLWASGDGSPVFPYDGHSFRPYARPRMFFPGFGLFLGFILLMFFFGGIGRMVRYRYWREKGRPYPPHWGPGWHKYHHPPFKGDGPCTGDPEPDGNAEDETSSEG